ncbi:MAG: hypothetical protein Q9226_002917, partial [Calogaya cf. arnoldii]
MGPEYFTHLWKVNTEQPDVFGFMRSQGETSGNPHDSQEPCESTDQLAGLPGASKVTANGHTLPPNAQSLQDIIHGATKARDAEREERERRLLAGAKKPDPNSEDPREQLAAYWNDPKNKAELRKWWD